MPVPNSSAPKQSLSRRARRAARKISGRKAQAALLALAAACAVPPVLAQEAAVSAPTAPPVSSATSSDAAGDTANDTATDDTAATLLADQITVSQQNQLTAEGHVEIYYQQNRLTAKRVIYDKATDRLTIEGPLRLTQPGEAGSVLVADSADLSRDLQNGVLIGARMVMARELQLAAAQASRKDGRTTTLNQVVASSCRICASDPTPLWEIRARSITHDADTHLLHFKDAQFRFMGVPLLWTPALRLPDPTVKRLSGFLRPEFRTTTNLGPGLKLPYFIALGPSSDLTLTPYIAANHTDTLGFRYRQATDAGKFSVEGALSRDGIKPGDTRGYVFADGVFALPDGYNLGAQLRMVTDPSYLLDYDITDDDRLWSGLWLEKIRANQMIWMRAGHTHSIRSGESNSTQPMSSADFVWSRVIRPDWVGGEATIDWESHAHRRSSDRNYDTLTDDDLVSDGRDQMRNSLTVNWRRQWLLPGGLLAASLARLDADAVLVQQDEDWTGDTLRALPTIGTELRWPWVRTSGKAAEVIEPIAQILWSPDHLSAVPNEDSLLTEFDEGNLFSFSRFSGGDDRERGLRANVGVSWTRLDASGWSLGLTGGRVFWARDLDQYPEGSGLSGKESDWLLGATITSAHGLTIANRALFDDQFDFSRDELRVGYFQGAYKLAAGYIWMDANRVESRDDALSELTLEGSWPWSPNWSSSLETRYDFTAERAAKAGIGLKYANECMSVNLSLSRRFTSSSTVTPETSVGLTVQLAGFGAGSETGLSDRACRG